MAERLEFIGRVWLTSVNPPPPPQPNRKEVFCAIFSCVSKFLFFPFSFFFFFLILNWYIESLGSPYQNFHKMESVQLLRTANYILRQSKMNLLKREKEESKIFRRSRFERGPKDRRASRSMINMNNSRPILSLITRAAASNNGVIVSIHPPLSILPSSFFHQIPRRDACRCHYGSRRWGKVGAKLLNRRLRNQITDRDTTMPMHYLWPMPRASYTHTLVQARSVETGWMDHWGLPGALIISERRRDSFVTFPRCERMKDWDIFIIVDQYNRLYFIRLNLNRDLVKFVLFLLFWKYW